MGGIRLPATGSALGGGDRGWPAARRPRGPGRGGYRVGTATCGSGGPDRNAGAGLHGGQLTDVVERLAPDVARAGEAGLVPARDRGAAVGDRDRVAVAPEGELAGRDDGARVALARRRDRRAEIDPLAPGRGGRGERGGLEQRLGGRRVEELGADRDVADLEDELLCGHARVSGQAATRGAPGGTVRPQRAGPGR